MYKDTFFEWDEEKEETNISKHGISFLEAREAFSDPKRIILKDIKHSKNEVRMYCIGLIRTKIVMVGFVKRKRRIRIFGAGAWRQAKSLYDKKNKT